MPRAFDTRRIEVIDDMVADIYRRMTPARRLEIAFDSHRFARVWMHKIVSDKHPDWSAAAVEAEVRRRTIGAAA
jgi:hypothetical protein